MAEEHQEPAGETRGQLQRVPLLLAGAVVGMCLVVSTTPNSDRWEAFRLSWMVTGAVLLMLGWHLWANARNRS